MNRMAQNDKIQLFEDKRIRTAWDEEKEEWYFSIVDVVAVLTDQPDQRGASNYWAKLKQRLKEEGAEMCIIDSHGGFPFSSLSGFCTGGWTSPTTRGRSHR